MAAFNWQQFLTLAEELHTSQIINLPKEASERSAISRAYYAAFHAALDFAEDKGYNPKFTGDDHADVREYIDQISTDLSTDLGRLHKSRCNADYDNQLETEPARMAAKALTTAKRIITQIEILTQFQ